MSDTIDKPESFLAILEQEEQNLEEDYDTVLEFLYYAYSDNFEEMREELELTDDEFDELHEAIVKRVSSKGQITKLKDRKTRSRRATLKTGMSKAALRRRGRKAAKARRRNPTAVRKAVRKRRKAFRKRRQMGLKPQKST